MSDGDAVQMQIGQVAARTELSIATVRHYDEVGLVTPSARSAGGFRLYAEVDVERLLVIRRMKPLGFTLAEMRELLDSLDDLAGDAASDVRRAEASDVRRAEAARLLDECRAKAEVSAVKLRKHLAYAEELQSLLASRAETVAGAGRDPRSRRPDGGTLRR